MKTLLLPLLMLASFMLSATEVSHIQLSKAQAATSKLDINALTANTNQIAQALTDLNSPAASIMAKSLLLKGLRHTEPTAEQSAWVKEQLGSSDKLEIANPDHPRQKLELINIARQAKNTLFQWQVNKKSAQILASWTIQNWHWPEFLADPTEVDYRAVAQAIGSTDRQTVSWLQDLLTEQALKQASNRLLTLLIAEQVDNHLLNRLWTNPTDQYSYQMLQRIHTLLPAEQAIGQLKAASQQANLLSQSLLLLTKNFQRVPSAQNFLIEKLQQPQSSWHAAAALSQVSDKNLIRKIRHLADSSNSGAIQFAAQQLTLE